MRITRVEEVGGEQNAHENNFRKSKYIILICGYGNRVYRVLLLDV